MSCFLKFSPESDGNVKITQDFRTLVRTHLLQFHCTRGREVLATFWLLNPLKRGVTVFNRFQYILIWLALWRCLSFLIDPECGHDHVPSENTCLYSFCATIALGRADFEIIITNKILSLKTLRTNRFEAPTSTLLLLWQGSPPWNVKREAADPVFLRPGRLHSFQIPKAQCRIRVCQPCLQKCAQGIISQM